VRIYWHQKPGHLKLIGLSTGTPARSMNTLARTACRHIVFYELAATFTTTEMTMDTFCIGLRAGPAAILMSYYVSRFTVLHLAPLRFASHRCLKCRQADALIVFALTVAPHFRRYANCGMPGSRHASDAAFG